MPTNTKRKVPPLKGTGGKPWSKQEVNFIRRNYQRLTDKQMADTLNRGVGGVTWKRTSLGLKKEATYKELQNKFGGKKPSTTSGATVPSPTVAPTPPAAPKKPWWKFW